MSTDAILAWETGDPADVRDLLVAIGFTAARGGALAIPGLLVEVTTPPGSAGRLRADRHERSGRDHVDRLRQLGRFEAAQADRLQPAGTSRQASTVGWSGGVRLRAIALATVDLARAGAALGGLAANLADDGLLGARVAATRTPWVVLLEPLTEGRLAATLARHGEGPAGLYLAAPAAIVAGLQARLIGRGERPRLGRGPFGPELLARTRDPWGPHVLLVPDAPRSDADEPRSETADPRASDAPDAPRSEPAARPVHARSASGSSDTIAP